MTLGVPSSPGVPGELAAHTITLSFNDIDGGATAFDELGPEIACVIVEPIAGNMNMVPAGTGFSRIPSRTVLCTRRPADIR